MKEKSDLSVPQLHIYLVFVPPDDTREHPSLFSFPQSPSFLSFFLSPNTTVNDRRGRGEDTTKDLLMRGREGERKKKLIPINPIPCLEDRRENI